MSHRSPVRVADRHAFHTLIDARSPAEYALDHLPGAINCPVLDDDERRIVGTIPWQWRWIVAGIRLTRIMRKSAKQQMKQFNKLQRQMIRRVLPRHKAMRGARAR